MKRILSISLVTLSLLMGVSCDKQDAPSTSEDNSISLSSSSSSEVKNSKWGSEYNDLIIGTLGDDIPYIEAPSFEIVESKDDFGDPLIIFYLFFAQDSLDASLENYAQIAADDGYTVDIVTQGGFDPDTFTSFQYDVYYADKELDDVNGIELQFLIGNYKNKECVGIFAYNYIITPDDAWPTNLVISLLGHDIPHLEDTGNYAYETHINATEGGKYIDMIITGVANTCEDDYANLLKNNGYQVTEEQYDEETWEYMGRFAFPQNDESFAIQFGLSQYGLEIFIYKFA